MNKFLENAGWSLMLLLAIAISGYAFAFFAIENLGSPALKAKFALMPLASYLHILGGGIALLVGPFQLNSFLRDRYLTLHRIMGRVYLTVVLLSGLGGLYMATVSMGGLPGHFGFGSLAVLWLITGSMAFVRIKQGDVESHRKWMIRNYALTLAAVTLRIYLPIFPSLFQVDFEQAYIAISWFCWVPNLVVAEWLFLNKSPEAPIVA